MIYLRATSLCSRPNKRNVRASRDTRDPATMKRNEDELFRCANMVAVSRMAARMERGFLGMSGLPVRAKNGGAM